MIIQYREKNLSPYIMEGADIKLKEVIYDDLVNYSGNIMIKEYNNDDYILGSVISIYDNNLNIFDKQDDFFSKKIRAIPQSQIEKLYKIIYIEFDLDKYNQYLSQ